MWAIQENKIPDSNIIGRINNGISIHKLSAPILPVKFQMVVFAINVAEPSEPSHNSPKGDTPKKAIKNNMKNVPITKLIITVKPNHLRLYSFFFKMLVHETNYNFNY